MRIKDIIFPDEVSKDDPPPTDMFYPTRTLLAKNLIDTSIFALALGLGSATLFILISLLAAFQGINKLQYLFNLLLPGFSTNLLITFLIGIGGSFLTAFILGAAVALIYNHYVRISYQIDLY